MNKRLFMPGNNGKERDIFIVNEDRNFLIKHASAYHPKVQEYINKAKPVDNLIQVLLTALGAYPFWMQNVNGDRFPIDALSHTGDDYGWKTFLTNGNYFTHHVNKDPNLAKGKILHSVYNEKQKRIELVVGINPDLDPDAATEIANGNDLAFSMGTKIPWDVCSICGNKARTRSEYCDHLKYLMNQIDPETGRLVGAVNLHPKFFDISRVLIPADKTAYMWTKIAAGSNPIAKLGSAYLATLPAEKMTDMDFLSKQAQDLHTEGVERGVIKTSTVKKQADIIKRTPLIAAKIIPEKAKSHLHAVKMALDAKSPTIDMKKFSVFTLPEIISTMVCLGMIPKPEEAETLGEIYNIESVDLKKYGPEHFSDELAEKLIPFLTERSFARPILLKRVLMLKKEDMKKVAAEDKKNDHFHAGVAAGILAALFAMFEPVTGAGAKGFGRTIADHPFISMALGAGLVRGLREASKGPLISGNNSLADPTQGLYNNDWQRRFALMQNHPVTVIKTGADKTIEPQIKQAYAGIPAFFLTDVLDRQPAQSLLDKNPEIFINCLMDKSATTYVNDLTSELVTSSSRFMKQASITDIDFLDSIPEFTKNDVWDWVVIKTANELSKNG